MTTQKGFCRPLLHGVSTSGGFTILELLFSLVLLAVAIGLAAPSLQQLSANNQLVAANNSIVTGLNLARSAAITTGDDVTICPSTNGTSCADDEWESGWIIFQDADGDGDADADEIVRTVSIESAISNTGFGDEIVFQSDGTTSMGSNATITSCYEHSGYNESCMNVVVNQFGSIESTKQETESDSEG